MADINHPHEHDHVGIGPVEADGINYRGIIWFVAIMAATVVVSQVLMVGAFKWFDHQFAQADTPRAPLARPQGQLPPAPNLLYEQSGTPAQNEPGHLRRFLEQEDARLNGYAFDAGLGIGRIPIDRAKALLLERGLPVRAGAAR